eukprot:958877-Prymnesium_polylepis.1
MGAASALVRWWHQRCAQALHKRCTSAAQALHKRCTGGAQEVLWRCASMVCAHRVAQHEEHEGDRVRP